MIIRDAAKNGHYSCTIYGLSEVQVSGLKGLGYNVNTDYNSLINSCKVSW